MRKVLRIALHAFIRLKLLTYYILHSSAYFTQSYFPEKRHKSKCKIFLEQCAHILRYGEINAFYYIYGLDVHGTSFKKGNYMAYRKFEELRNKRNYTIPYSYVCILRNKDLFSLMATHWGYACASNIGYLDSTSKNIIFPNKESIDIISLVRQKGDLFLKPCDAECGQGVFSLGYKDDTYYIDDIKVDEHQVLQKINSITETYLVQQRVIQHPEMNRMYPHSVNTLRITTVTNRHTKEVELFHSLLRVGASGNVVDNWAKGGLIMSVKEDGTLSDIGYYKPGYGTTTTAHPDSQIYFKDFQIPFYKEAVEMCIAFHKDLNHISAIGWDVAITPNGPMFIEGNDNWEISMHQTFGGQKEHFESLLK